MHHSRGLRCFHKDRENSPCSKQLLVPTAIIISNFLDVLDMSSSVSEQCHPLNNDNKTLLLCCSVPLFVIFFFYINLADPCFSLLLCAAQSHSGKSSGQSPAGWIWGTQLLKCWEADLREEKKIAENLKESSRLCC